MQQIVLLSIGILTALFPSKYIAKLIVKKYGEIWLFNNIIIVAIIIFTIPYFLLHNIIKSYGIEFLQKYQYLIMIIMAFAIGIPLHINSIQTRKK